MLQSLRNGLSHRNGIVRKASTALLTVPKWCRSVTSSADERTTNPPVLVNSFPKSGTHLLAQIVDALPGRSNYGTFLASMTSSFQFRERSPENAGRVIRRFTPGEIVRGHLFYDPQTADDLRAMNTVHYFIYRDPRDVVVSEAHYLREMNRWHRLSRYFRERSIEEAITLSITGFDPPIAGLEYPNIAKRFERYAGWLECPDCFCMRFEDLRSAECERIVRQAATFFFERSGHGDVDVEAFVRSMVAQIAPSKSHTFRSGKKKGWQQEFTPEHYRLFASVAGDLLERLNYEPNDDWGRDVMNTAAATPLNTQS